MLDLVRRSTWLHLSIMLRRQQASESYLRSKPNAGLRQALLSDWKQSWPDPLF